MRHLEELWRLPLFARGRHLSLTPAGHRLAPIVRQFLVSMEAALADLHGPDAAVALKVSLTQSFAVKWLLPRLPDFAAATPAVNIWISTTDEMVDFSTAEVDAAIRLGTGAYSPLHAEPLLREYIFPVASPALVARSGPVAAARDILRYPLILRSGKPAVPRWEYWFGQVGLHQVTLPPGPRYPDTAMTIEAALAGQGAALVRSAHITDELASGRLVKLLDRPVLSPITYYLVCAAGHQVLPAISAFRAWIVGQAAAAQALYDERDGPAVSGSSHPS